MTSDLSMSPELLEIFHEELAASLEALEAFALAALEPEELGGEAEARLKEVFRQAHTIKGNAYTLGFEAMGELAHRFEELCREAQERPAARILELGRVTLTVVDALRGLSHAPDADTGAALATIGEALAALRRPGGAPAPSRAPRPSTVKLADSAPVDRVQVSLSQLDDLFHELEQLRERACEAPALAAGVEALSRRVLEMRQVPFSRLETRLRRVVRDASEALGRPVDFDLAGLDLRIDAALLDDLAVMLPHLLRNSIDHGIEAPELRAQAGKPERGRLTLRCAESHGTLLVSLEDDGRGIDPELVLTRAVERGLVTASEAPGLTHFERLHLIFAPGFSTREGASRLSGRGVGLDVVATRAAERKGRVEVSSSPGQGSRFELRYPLRFVWESVFLARLGDGLIGVPVGAIAALLTTEEVPPVEDGALAWEDALLPLIGATTLDPRFPEVGGRPLIVLELGAMRVGMAVDALEDFEGLLVQTIPAERKPPAVRGLGRTRTGELVRVLDLEALERDWNAYTVPE